MGKSHSFPRFRYAGSLPAHPRVYLPAAFLILLMREAAGVVLAVQFVEYDPGPY